MRRSCFAVAVAVLLAGAAAPARAQLQCQGGTLEYHPDGALKGCVIEAYHRVFTPAGDAVHCAPGHALTQHPSGDLASCVIDRPHTLAGEPCDRVGRVELDPEGRLLACGQL